MTKEDRFAIIAKYSGKEHPKSSDINRIIDFFILDELKYAGRKAWFKKLNTLDEFNKVLEAYSFDGYNPSPCVINYIKHYSLNPQTAAMQHTDLNDNISYIGEYYDGTPTTEYRKKDRYKIEPIYTEDLSFSYGNED